MSEYTKAQKIFTNIGIYGKAVAEKWPQGSLSDYAMDRLWKMTDEEFDAIINGNTEYQLDSNRQGLEV